MNLHVEKRAAPNSRPPLVLIHGFGGHAASWAKVLDRLPASLPVIAYDLPGHGRSLHAEGRGGAGRMAKAILADLQAQGLAGFHLAGHSMGGAVAALIGMRAGARLRSLTLIAPGGMGPDINADALERFAKARLTDEIAEVMRIMAAPDFAMPTSTLAALADDRARPGVTEALEETFAAMFTEETSSVRAQGTLPMELLETLIAPVAVLWGEEDAILPSHQMDRLPQHFEKIRLPGKGHMLLDEAPDAVAELLIRQAG